MTARVPPANAADLPADVRDAIGATEAGVGEARNVFMTLAHHPGLLRRYLPFGGKLFAGGKLSARDRELVVLRTAYVCVCRYEWAQHVGIARSAGVTEDELARVAAGPSAPEWSARDRLLLRSVDELRAEARLSAATWDALTAEFHLQQLIELLMLVGNYVMLAGVLNTLQTELEPDVAGIQLGRF